MMDSVQEIKDAIAALSPREMREVYSWLEDVIAARVDAAIARDLDAGAFDDAIKSALADKKAGRVRAL